MPYALVLVVLLIVTVIALRYRSGWGFLGLWFFLILAPSSSFLPIISEIVAEHRMYLPLAAVVVAVVVCGYCLGGHLFSRLVSSDDRRLALERLLGYALAGVVVFALGFATAKRNHDYRSELSIWQDTVVKQLDNPRAYNNRGQAYKSRGQHELATRDYNKAIELDPAYAKAYNNRGNAYGSKGEYDQAIRDLNKAIKLDPKNAHAYYSNRGVVYRDKGDLEQAIRDFDQAIALDPAYATAYNNLAWILATCPDPQIRDGAEAVHLAERACGLGDNRVPTQLDTLAAAYAELGQFDQAVETAEKAVRLALAAGQQELAKDIRNRLELYKAKRPFRTSARQQVQPDRLSPPNSKDEP